MAKVSTKRVVKNPRDRVWRLLANVGLVSEYDPHVRVAEVISPKNRPAGIGTARRCWYWDGTSAREEVVQLFAREYLVIKVRYEHAETNEDERAESDVTTREDDDAPNYCFSAPPVREMTVKYSATPLGPCRTEIRIEVVFDSPSSDESLGASSTGSSSFLPCSSLAFWCFDLRFLRRFALRMKVKRRLAATLQGMDRYLVTGERVDM